MIFSYTFCDREFGANKWLKIHSSEWALKKTQVIENNKTYNEDVMDENLYSGT